MAIKRISISQTFQPEKVEVVPSAKMGKVYTFLRVLVYSVVATIILLYMFGGKSAIIGETTPLRIPSEGQQRHHFPTEARNKTSNMTAPGAMIDEEQRKQFNDTADKKKNSKYSKDKQMDNNATRAQVKDIAGHKGENQLGKNIAAQRETNLRSLGGNWQDTINRMLMENEKSEKDGKQLINASGPQDENNINKEIDLPTDATVEKDGVSYTGLVPLKKVPYQTRKSLDNGGDISKDVTKQTENEYIGTSGNTLNNVTKQTESVSIGTRENIIKDVTKQTEHMSIDREGNISKNVIHNTEELHSDIGGNHIRNTTKKTKNRRVNIGGNKNAYQQSGNSHTDSETATKPSENMPANMEGNINQSAFTQRRNLTAIVKGKHRENATKEKISVDVEGNVLKNVSEYELFTQSRDAAVGNKTLNGVNRTIHPRFDTEEKTKIDTEEKTQVDTEGKTQITKEKTQIGTKEKSESSKCANPVEKIKHLEFIKAWNDVRDSQQYSAITILQKLCSKCGVIIHVEFPINATTPSCNIIIKGTITLILSAERGCQNDMMSKTLLSYIEEELELELSPLSTIVLLNQSSPVGRQLMRTTRSCSHSIKQTSNVIIGYIQSEVTYLKPLNTPFTNGSKTLMNSKEKVSYMIYLYLGYTYCMHDSWNRSSPEKFNCFSPKNHPGFTVTNYSLEPHRFLFQGKALCGIDSGLLYRLQSMAAITSLKRSLGATLRLKMNKLAAKSGILARLLHDKWMIFEEIDGRIAELLHRYRVCNTTLFNTTLI